MRTPITVLAILLTLAAAAPRLHAQSPHVASQAVLDAAIQQHLDQTAAQREAVLRVLDRDEVKAVAGRVGIDVTTAATAVASLQGDELARAAAQAQQVEQALAGGQSRVVISTTTIIIVLLVIILLVVAID
jgi:ferritin-like metal-binding protein YciE